MIYVHVFNPAAELSQGVPISVPGPARECISLPVAHTPLSGSADEPPIVPVPSPGVSYPARPSFFTTPYEVSFTPRNLVPELRSNSLGYTYTAVLTQLLFEYAYPSNMLDPGMDALQVGLNTSSTFSTIEVCFSCFRAFIAGS